MLEVQKFLLEHDSLDKLTEQYAIKVNIWDDKLVVLNYCQIDSPKTHPITIECRSLVLELDSWKVVSRSFDRFLNYGENESGLDNHDDIDCMYEKIDGSLICIFKYHGTILWRTRSMICPTNDILTPLGFGITWERIFNEAYDIDDISLIDHMDRFPDETIICELVSKYNRVVVPYNEPKLYLLGIRNNITGKYINGNALDVSADNLNLDLPEKYTLKSLDDCLTAVSNLRRLEEGFVVYDEDNNPLYKVKSPAYVAAHRLRGEATPTGRNIIRLLITNEYTEFLTIFPEYDDLFEPYIDAYDDLKRYIYTTTIHVKHWFVDERDRKESVMKLKQYINQLPLTKQQCDVIFSCVIFIVTRNEEISIKDYFLKLTKNRVVDIINAFKKG